ncbi:hypothetical protein B0H10DRAFT_1961931 [Mycena sp. CBHHK59/15]|nr:hypothetical protein B0H10DRAFT_1961931 [Mycena sp. CBHHK59/15]
MASQTNASFTTMLSHQATASTDSLVNSLLDTSTSPTPPTRAKKVTAAAATAASGSASAPPAAGPLKTAPSGKAEATSAGIKHLDSNMGAVSSRLENYISDNNDRVEYLTANLKRVSDDLAVAGLGNSTGPAFTASDMLAHPTFLALITSVGVIDGLRAETASLCAEVTTLHAAKRKRDMDNAPTYSDDNFLPAVKHISPSTHYDTGPGSVPEAPPTVSAHQNTAVEVGPVVWGKDISGQVRALIGRMAHVNTIDADAVKNLHAKRFTKNNWFITVFFPSS